MNINNMNQHLSKVIDRYIETQNQIRMKHEVPCSSADLELSEVMREYIIKNKNDYENFMEPTVIRRYVNDSRECTVFVSGMKKRIWKPDRFMEHSRRRSESDFN